MLCLGKRTRLGVGTVTGNYRFSQGSFADEALAGILNLVPGSLPVNDETKELARRIIWFDPPEKSLADWVRLATYAFNYATKEDMQLLRKHLSDEDLRVALRLAPPGIFFAQSWRHWHLALGVNVVPPMPVRIIP